MGVDLDPESLFSRRLLRMDGPYHGDASGMRISYKGGMKSTLTQRKAASALAGPVSRLGGAALGKLGEGLSVADDDLATTDSDKARALPCA